MNTDCGSKLDNNEDVLKCLRSLKPTDCIAYRDRLLQKYHEGTCSWILSYPKYQHWNDDDNQRILWVHGIAGSGKSTLSAFLSERFEKNRTRGSPGVCYFFCDDKDDRLRTDHAILRDLLDQVLQQRPHALRHFLAERDYAMYKETTSWNPEMFWRVLTRCLSDKSLGLMYFIIDALGKTSTLQLHYLWKRWLTVVRRM